MFNLVFKSDNLILLRDEDLIQSTSSSSLGDSSEYLNFIEDESIKKLILGSKKDKVKSITVKQLKEWFVTDKDFQLVDVRENSEYEKFDNMNKAKYDWVKLYLAIIDSLDKSRTNIDTKSLILKSINDKCSICNNNKAIYTHKEDFLTSC